MFNKKIRFLIIISTLFFGFLNNALSQTSICTSSGYTVGFFNGVFNDFTEAGIAAKALEKSLPTTINDEIISVELFYNSSGKVSGSGATRYQDLAEVFNQRSQEQGGALNNQWEFFWSSIGSNSGFWNTIITADRNLEALFSEWQDNIKLKILSTITGMFSSPPTANDYKKHQLRINALINEKQKILFVAHSQGNLFVNIAYSYAKTLTSIDSVKVVHVAPASIVLNGDYILSNNDKIINALRFETPGNIPNSNTILSFSTIDVTGHYFIETYLDINRAAYTKIVGQSLKALNALVTPSTNASQGFFTATLTWDGYGDVDLHVFEPNNKHVFYDNKIGEAGFLDIDDTIAHGPEHYYASCDPTKLITGTYKIAMNNYNGASNRVAFIQIAGSDNGVIYTSPLPVSVGEALGSAGNASPIHLIDVIVSKDSFGKYKVTTQ